MNFTITMLLLFTVFSASANVSKEKLMEICKKTPWDGRCYVAGFEAWRAGNNVEAEKWLTMSCAAAHGPSCHVIGLIHAFDKNNAQNAAKGKKALERACKDLKYDGACKDLKKL